jgi:hypothetical protein
MRLMPPYVACRGRLDLSVAAARSFRRRLPCTFPLAVVKCCGTSQLCQLDLLETWCAMGVWWHSRFRVDREQLPPNPPGGGAALRPIERLGFTCTAQRGPGFAWPAGLPTKTHRATLRWNAHQTSRPPRSTIALGQSVSPLVGTLYLALLLLNLAPKSLLTRGSKVHDIHVCDCE